MDMLPKWAREIGRFLSVKSQFALWGNVFDIYPMEIENSLVILPLYDYLRRFLAEVDYDVFFTYEPLEGFVAYNVHDDHSQNESLNFKISDITGVSFQIGKPEKNSVPNAAEIIEKIIYNKHMHCAVWLNFASRYQDICKQDIDEFFYRMLTLSARATPTALQKDDVQRAQFNLLFWILNKENDIPAWYTVDNPKIRVLPIPKPDNVLRRGIIEKYAIAISGYGDLSEDKRQDALSLFVDQTNGLFGTEISAITQICRKENLSFNEIEEGIRRYKLGIVENPWTKLDMDVINRSEEILSQRVMGQKYAVTHTSDIVKRSVFSLSGSQYAHSQRPKGIVFFAGPTGVGKTELAKSLTELIFGSPTNYIRFDMSEFGHEHADQRLIGAPPGYVGYDVGGELTNAIKQNPFSVVLFDEIEKAHRKIFDLFLQILDDGRLTSGRGETVYFSESLIIFTSNLGIYENAPDGTKQMLINPKDSYELVNAAVNKSIREFFTFNIGRPEILNRIGENIVVFDFIRSENGTAQAIFNKMLKSVLARLKETHKISLQWKQGTRERLMDHSCERLDMGGRGIGNSLERVFINPLSRALFDVKAKEGETFTVSGLKQDNGIWNIELERPS